MINEQRYRELIQQLATGGITGNKTYHQYHDQFVPMDSESMGYMNGGGIGTMMQPRQNFAGGGGDFEPLGYQDESITVEDLTNRNNGNFLISAADALPDQTGTISSMPSITNRDLRTIEGSLIDGDDPSSRYAVQQDFPSTIDRFSNSVAPVPPGVIPDRNRGQIPSGIMSSYTQPSADYPDMIRNPENFPNRLQNLERFQDNRFEDLEFQEGFNFKDAPNETNTLQELYQNRNFIDNPRTGFFDKTIMSKGNSDASLVNKTKNAIGSGITGVMDFMGKIPTPFNMIKGFANSRNALSKGSQNYNPALQGQIDFLNNQNAYGKNASSGLAQITSGRLAGKNLQSLFGSNDLQTMYDKDLASLEKNLEKLDTRFSKLKRDKPKDFLAKQQRIIDKINQNKAEAAQAKAAADQAAKAGAQSFMQQNPNYGNNYNPNRAGGYTGAKDSYGNKSGTRQSNARSSDLGFSDIRLKDNIELVGKSPSDINIYNFTYLNDPKVYQGVMAQEVPWASVKHDSGYLMVDYNKVDVDFKSV